jgi:D-alanine transaminase
VYEVLVFRGQRPILLAQHLARLAASCREILLDCDLRALRIEALIQEGVRRAEFAETMVHVQITRGAAPRHHLFPTSVPPTVAMTFRPKPSMPAGRREAGIAVCTVADDRWARCHIKSVALLANILARNAAAARGFDDALFLGPEGDVREAAAANFFAIRGGRLHTPVSDATILPGITRQWILACARRLQVPICENRLRLAEVLSADEAFVSSTTVELLPVVRVDDQLIGRGRPGPVSKAIHDEMLRDLERPDFTV